MKYLLSLGHTDIMYISGNNHLSTEIERFNGYRKALEEAHIGLDTDLVVNGEYSW
jgi:DNA-binding LacI/PurR family transcriptional regulator